jgi:hypothetical protein
MGRLKSSSEYPPLTEERIQELLHLRRPLLTSPKYEAYNVFLYGWESDYVAFSKNGYVYEAEIKISRSDFQADLRNKAAKHTALSSALKGEGGAAGPNRFVYVCPEGVIRPEDLETLPYAGLLWVDRRGVFSWKVGLPEIHGAKWAFTDAELAEKFNYGLQNMARRFWSKGVVDISAATKARYERLLMEYDEMLSERSCEIDELKNRLKKANIEIPK